MNMRIELSPNRKLTELKKDFNTLFSFLKLEFYANAHKDFELSNHADLLDDDLVLSEIGFTQNGSVFYEFSDNTTVKEMEQYWKTELGLNIQVFKFFAGVWIETSKTDHWSLRQQSEMCGSASDPNEIFTSEKHDYDLEDKR